MDRINRRNLVKIRRLAEQAMREADYVLDIDGTWNLASSIHIDIDNLLEKNGQPYTGTNGKFGYTTGLHPSEEPEEEGYVCCS